MHPIRSTGLASSFQPKLTLPLLRAALYVACLAPLAVGASEFTPLSDLTGGGFASYAAGVSDDGTVVVGRSIGASGYEAIRWTEAGGMVGLGDLAGGLFESLAYGVSGDGAVVVGRGRNASSQFEAFRWTQAGGIVGLGDLPGGQFESTAFATNGDGSVVVGYGNNASFSSEAFRWTQGGGMVGLGDLAGGGTSSFALGVNDDGSVVVGMGSSASGNEAFRWTQAGGMVGLGDLTGGSFFSQAFGVSSNGSVVVGYSTSASGQEAFRWTQAGGMVGLGDLAGGGFESVAYGVNSDGSVVVGRGLNASSSFEAFRWTQAGGMQSVTDWLAAAGVTVAPGYLLASAKDVSADGSTVVGESYGPSGAEAFLARVSAVGSGSVSLAGLQQSLLEASRAGDMTLGMSNLVMHGEHSRPLARRVAAGQKVIWVSGDWGTDNHDTRDGDLGAAELGGGANLGSVQLNLSLGQAWGKQNLSLAGEARADGTYLMAEAILPLPNKLWATFDAYGMWGEADIRRGYLNAGLPTTSDGNTDTFTWGLRARLDWDDALAFGQVSLTPYADLSHSETRTDAYTETGGGFPVAYDARTNKATELRIGANASRPLAGTMRLIGIVEAAHLFQENQADTRGQVVGLFSFDIAGTDNKQTWLRAGGGVEGKLGDGMASLMLNVTTEGAAPDMWLATAYHMAF
ncbi:autotransporter domain-containing protein [Thiobacillus sp.]|uniref:autotransporter domain-containing protein n=1 Tax=Thiobacillus sp. TaxID=924 RepID=UPI00286E6996|nr:autotransporter domain-containing protein [Thiobacillus sp.]